MTLRLCFCFVFGMAAQWAMAQYPSQRLLQPTLEGATLYFNGAALEYQTTAVLDTGWHYLSIQIPAAAYLGRLTEVSVKQGAATCWSVKDSTVVLNGHLYDSVDVLLYQRSPALEERARQRELRLVQLEQYLAQVDTLLAAIPAQRGRWRSKERYAQRLFEQRATYQEEWTTLAAINDRRQWAAIEEEIRFYEGRMHRGRRTSVLVHVKKANTVVLRWTLYAREMPWRPHYEFRYTATTAPLSLTYLARIEKSVLLDSLVGKPVWLRTTNLINHPLIPNTLNFQSKTWSLRSADHWEQTTSNAIRWWDRPYATPYTSSLHLLPPPSKLPVISAATNLEDSIRILQWPIPSASSALLSHVEVVLDRRTVKATYECQVYANLQVFTKIGNNNASNRVVVRPVPCLLSAVVATKDLPYSGYCERTIYHDTLPIGSYRFHQPIHSEKQRISLGESPTLQLQRVPMTLPAAKLKQDTLQVEGGYTTTLINLGADTAAVNLIHSIPVSIDPDLVVTWLNEENLPTPKDGIITRQVKLPPQSKDMSSVRYQIRYPAQYRLVLPY